MQGLMMDMPLLISDLIRHADRHHGSTEIVSRSVEGGLHRYTYRQAHERARKLAKALKRLGLEPQERVATLAWNGFRHFEIYYAAAGSGAVIHTINPRLFHDQIVYIANHAEDRLVFFDLTFAALLEKIAPELKSVRHFVAMTDRAHMPKQRIPNLLCYEELLEVEGAEFEWPSFDERTAACLCYTSGTTGNPKGSLYAHRSTILHAYAAALPDALDLSARDVVLPVVPMFHVNAWGLPYSCALTGAKLVFPGAQLDGKSLHELFESEQVTMSAGVPTVWLGLLNYMKEQKLRFSTLKRVVVGGSACPPAMTRAFQDDHGVQVLHAWGMTEMSPLGVVCSFKAKHLEMGKEERYALQNKQGRAIYGVDLRVVGEDGSELPWDGKTIGDLQVRGPWVIRGYFKGEGGDPLRDGWFPTGDVVNIDPDGYIQITDRSKDVIKSGGEWISSIDLENIAIAHPAVAEAAVIGVQHPKWDERPIVVAVKRPGHEVSREELLGFYEGKIAKWWMPDDVVFVAELPHTATGKLSKLTLREQLKDYRLKAER
ncbi:MAG TPA: 3-(methylthio)propionyl-CoA ligase [Burkholderiales bacterium]|jgi:fatty-acyl-CoA synthase|nr:3-(methylthio)propionyl-CoA ligase [Burkholderiales bacterium]